MWTEANAPPPKLIVNNAVALLAEVGEANVHPHDESEEWKKDEQRKRLVPCKKGENEEGAENETCSNREAAEPQTLLVSGSSCPYPNPATDAKRNPENHESREVGRHRIVCHRPNEN
jgi:hypothetical protein